MEFDGSINVAIAILRKALADDAEHPKYIEPLARRGYRLIAPVEWQQSSTAGQELLEPQADTLPSTEGQISALEPSASKHWRKAAIIGASAVVLVVVGYMSWRHFRDVTAPRSQKIMLAVLPFENLTGDPNKEYLADGLTEETISQLGRLNPEQLGVRSDEPPSWDSSTRTYAWTRLDAIFPCSMCWKTASAKAESTYALPLS